MHRARGHTERLGGSAGLLQSLFLLARKARLVLLHQFAYGLLLSRLRPSDDRSCDRSDLTCGAADRLGGVDNNTLLGLWRFFSFFLLGHVLHQLYTNRQNARPKADQKWSRRLY